MREKNGWIIVDVVPEAIERAKAIRAERDQRYGNIFGSVAKTFCLHQILR
jgi:hypothetical protein